MYIYIDINVCVGISLFLSIYKYVSLSLYIYIYMSVCISSIFHLNIAIYIYLYADEEGRFNSIHLLHFFYIIIHHVFVCCNKSILVRIRILLPIYLYTIYNIFIFYILDTSRILHYFSAQIYQYDYHFIFAKTFPNARATSLFQTSCDSSPS